MRQPRPGGLVHTQAQVTLLEEPRGEVPAPSRAGEQVHVDTWSGGAFRVRTERDEAIAGGRAAFGAALL